MADREGPERELTIRPRAIVDIEEHAEYLEEHAPPEVPVRFRAAIMDAFNYVAQMPGAGARRKVRNSVLSNLRIWVVPGFNNYIVFYVMEGETIDVIRVIHGAQDVEAALEDEE